MDEAQRKAVTIERLEKLGVTIKKSTVDAMNMGELRTVCNTVDLAMQRASGANMCEFCGHKVKKGKPLPMMEAGPDGLIFICGPGCFCSYGGCKPERN